MNEFLKSQGWSKFLTIGDPEGDLGIELWQRREKGRSPEYLLQVSDINYLSPLLQVDSFPELMDLVSRWAPAVQAAAVSGLIREMWRSAYTTVGGLVETVAARAAYGTSEGLMKLQQQRSDAEEARRRRARENRRRQAAGEDPR